MCVLLCVLRSKRGPEQIKAELHQTKFQFRLTGGMGVDDRIGRQREREGREEWILLYTRFIFVVVAQPYNIHTTQPFKRTYIFVRSSGGGADGKTRWIKTDI